MIDNTQPASFRTLRANMEKASQNNDNNTTATTLSTDMNQYYMKQRKAKMDDRKKHGEAFSNLHQFHGAPTLDNAFSSSPKQQEREKMIMGSGSVDSAEFDASPSVNVRDAIAKENDRIKTSTNSSDCISTIDDDTATRQRESHESKSMETIPRDEAQSYNIPPLTKQQVVTEPVKSQPVTTLESSKEVAVMDNFSSQSYTLHSWAETDEMVRYTTQSVTCYIFVTAF